MEVIYLQDDTIEEISERTGRSVEDLQVELAASYARKTKVCYYFDLPEIEDGSQ
jgi:hypothetical protein